MAKNDELLKTLREYLHRDTAPRLISEDIEPVVLAAIDVVPLFLESDKRQYLISVIGFPDREAPRGAIPQRHAGEGENAEGLDFDAGTEYVDRDPKFWEMSENDREIYRSSFIPKDRSQIPELLPDYLGYLYEPGGLSSVFAGWDEPPSKDAQVQASLEAAEEIPPAAPGMVKVFDRPKLQWVDVPEEEIPKHRPAGSFGFYRLERYVTKGGKVKYKPYTRQIPNFPTSRGRGADTMTRNIKTPWQMFIDWWNIAIGGLLKTGYLQMAGGTESAPRPEERGKKREYFQRLMDENAQIKSGLESERAEKTAKYERGENYTREQKKIKRLREQLRANEAKIEMVKRYGSLAMRADERDYSKEPIRKPKRLPDGTLGPGASHPPLFNTAFIRAVKQINREAKKHKLSEEDLNDFVEAVVNVRVDELPSWLRSELGFFDIETKAGEKTHALLTRDLKALEKRRQQQRFAMHDPDYIPKGHGSKAEKRKKKEKEEKERIEKEAERWGNVPPEEMTIQDITARAAARRAAAWVRDYDKKRRSKDAPKDRAELNKSVDDYQMRMLKQIRQMRAAGWSDEEIADHIKTGIKWLDDPRHRRPEETLLYHISKIIAEDNRRDIFAGMHSKPGQEPKQEPSRSGETHCSKCDFPADVWGVFPEGKRGRRNPPEHLPDDVDAIQYVFTPGGKGKNRVDLANVDVLKNTPQDQKRKAKHDIELQAAQTILRVLQKSNPPKWINLRLESTKWKDTKSFKTYANVLDRIRKIMERYLAKNPQASPDELESMQARLMQKHMNEMPPSPEEMEKLADEPVSEVYGRIWVYTRARIPGRVPGHPNRPHPGDTEDEAERERRSRGLVSGHKYGGGDAAEIGKVSTFPVARREDGTYYISDLDGEDVFDASKIASADPETREQTWNDLKVFVRDWFTSGSMGKERAASMSDKQRKSRAGKTRQDRQKQLYGDPKNPAYEGVRDLIEYLRNACIVHKLPYGGAAIRFAESEVLEALAQVFARLGANISDPADIPFEEWEQIQSRIRTNVINWLRQAKQTPLVSFGDLLSAIRMQSEAIDSNNEKMARAAAWLIEEALERTMIEASSDVDADIDSLLQFGVQRDHARHLLSKNPRLFASALALQGRVDEALNTGAVTYNEAVEIDALREGASSESLRRVVKDAGTILASESYDAALKVFARVVPQLGREDLRHILKIAPQRIINNGVLENKPLEQVLEDIGVTYDALLSNSKNRKASAIWKKIGNL